MRCPKCSFVSFDLVESCVKCGKNISAAAAELQGTVVAVEPPTFLGVASKEVPPEAAEPTAGFDTEEPMDLGGEGEEETMDLSFDEGPAAEVEEVEMDFGEAEETTAAADLDLGFEEEVAVESEAGEGDVIGISDLAPVEEAEEVLAEGPADEEHEAAAAGAGGLGLEDLKVDGIDLDSPPGGVAESDKVLPSVKTGTALDDFDFDLGDLITSKDE